MKNEFTDSSAMYEKIDVVNLSPEVQLRFLEVLEQMLQDEVDPKGQEVLRVAIANLKTSMN